MDGLSVFSFAISKWPKRIKTLAETHNVDLEAFDLVILHQENLFMNERIRKKLKLRPDQAPYSLNDFGNTSCASIPLTMVTQCKRRLETEKITNIGYGFGIGLSGGTALFETDHIVVPELIELS